MRSRAHFACFSPDCTNHFVAKHLGCFTAPDREVIFESLLPEVQRTQATHDQSCNSAGRVHFLAGVRLHERCAALGHDLNRPADFVRHSGIRLSLLFLDPDVLEPIVQVREQFRSTSFAAEGNGEIRMGGMRALVTDQSRQQVNIFLCTAVIQHRQIDLDVVGGSSLDRGIENDLDPHGMSEHLGKQAQGADSDRAALVKRNMRFFEDRILGCGYCSCGTHGYLL